MQTLSFVVHVTTPVRHARPDPLPPLVTPATPPQGHTTMLLSHVHATMATMIVASHFANCATPPAKHAMGQPRQTALAARGRLLTIVH